jgi:hypothetical protein
VNTTIYKPDARSVSKRPPVGQKAYGRYAPHVHEHSITATLDDTDLRAPHWTAHLPSGGVISGFDSEQEAVTRGVADCCGRGWTTSRAQAIEKANHLARQRDQQRVARLAQKPKKEIER